MGTISVNPVQINHRRDNRQTKHTAVRQLAGSFQVVPTRPVNPALYIESLYEYGAEVTSALSLQTSAIDRTVKN